MGRNSSGVKQKMRKGLWSPEEDEKLYNYITRFGVGCWSSVPKLAGLQRCGKSCRLRWINYLRPDLKRGMFSQEEEDLILNLHEALGNRWAQIAAQLPGRTDNEIKNYWNSSLKKKLIKQGIDPNTHKPINGIENEPKNDPKDCTDSIFQPKALPNLTTQPQIEQQIYDPLFLPEFQANLDPDYYYFYHQSNYTSQNAATRPHYEHNSRIEGNFVNSGSVYNSMPDLSHFDHHQNMNEGNFDNSRTRMNDVKEGSSTFSWDGDNKLDSMFRFQFSGIQIEEGAKNYDQHQSVEDFSNYQMTSLSQEITEANLDVFNQI
ncbi:hypothetical protein CASFOL_027931 [Castilleja foliolosa]|uniref:Uncharacterized protein n=1 Tax=Castilleja foliolosa TaxID=1961234 RepID=A0ABD3CJH5_9LAMI